MLRVMIYLLATAAGSWLFLFMDFPAGWMIGALLVGIVYRFKVGELSLPSYVFPFAISLIGASIGLRMVLRMFSLFLEGKTSHPDNTNSLII